MLKHKLNDYVIVELIAVVYRYYINKISYTVNKIERCPILSESFTICNIVCLGLGICMEITHISNFILANMSE